jgi:hypothetical protein
MKRLQIKFEYSQPHEMAAAFGAPALGTALVVISRFYKLTGQAMQWAFFP